MNNMDIRLPIAVIVLAFVALLTCLFCGPDAICIVVLFELFFKIMIGVVQLCFGLGTN